MQEKIVDQSSQKMISKLFNVTQNVVKQMIMFSSDVKSYYIQLIENNKEKQIIYKYQIEVIEEIQQQCYDYHSLCQQLGRVLGTIMKIGKKYDKTITRERLIQLTTAILKQNLLQLDTFNKDLNKYFNEPEFKQTRQIIIQRVNRMNKFKKKQDRISQLINKAFEIIKKLQLQITNKKQQQLKLNRKIKEYENQYKIQVQNQLNTKDQQITKLNQQLEKVKLDLKTQQDLVKNHKNELDKKLQEIKTLKSDNQRSSIDLNKKIKQQKDKFDQLVSKHEQKVEELQFNLLTAQSKAQDLQRQLNEIRSSHGSASNGLTTAKQQISQLKQKLQDKQNQLTKIKTQMQQKKLQQKLIDELHQQKINLTQNNINPLKQIQSFIKSQNNDQIIVKLQTEIKENKIKIQQLKQQLSQLKQSTFQKSLETNKSFKRQRQELQAKIQYLTKQNQVFLNRFIESRSKVDQLEKQLAAVRLNPNF